MEISAEVKAIQEIKIFIHCIFIPVILTVVSSKILCGILYIGVVSFIYLFLLKDSNKRKIFLKYINFLISLIALVATLTLLFII